MVALFLAGQLAELFGLLLAVDIDDSWQVRRACVPVGHLESNVTLSWFFSEILTIEWMAVFVGLAMCNVPPVVPVFGLESFLSFLFRKL